GADERGTARPSARDEEHDVDTVGDHRDPDDDAGEAAFEQEVDPGADEDGDEDDEREARGGVDHRGPPSVGRAPPLQPAGAASGAASSAATCGESNGTSGATSPSRSPWRSTSAPRVRRMSRTSPTTTR